VRPVAVREVSRNRRAVVRETANNSKILNFPSRAARPLGFTSVNVHLFSVGRPRLDPGTLGLKGTCEVLLCVGWVV